jgi:hypothetical protein
MFVTFFSCIGLALFINRFILGNRAEFIGLQLEAPKQSIS